MTYIAIALYVLGMAPNFFLLLYDDETHIYIKVISILFWPFLWAIAILMEALER